MFKCPVCDFDHVMVYSAKEGTGAYVVCGRCRTLKTFEKVSKHAEPIDLYNAYCDSVRSRMGSYVEIQTRSIKQTPSRPISPDHALSERNKETGGSVVFAAPLCELHEFAIGEPIRGFKGEMLAQTRICLKCGHAERDKV